MESQSKLFYPKISIITPSFNQGQYLEQTILSVVEQDYPNLEYIIIDGGSTDNSVEIIKKYANKITFWVSEPDKGQSDAINKGMKVATGDIINWLNSDDYYESDSLFKVAEAFDKPGTQIVAGRSKIFSGQNEVLYTSQGTDIYKNNLAKTIGWARIDQPETFFRKEVIEKIGPLDNRLHYIMDRDWWIKYLFNYGLDKVSQIPDILVNFRLHQESKTVSQASGFWRERDTYYYALAKGAGLKEQANVLKNNTYVNEDFELNKSSFLNEKIIPKVLNYYYLLRANEFYIQNNKAKTKIFLQNIRIDWLEEADKQVWRKLYYRNRYVPTSIIKLFRK
ncbi:hypothetical protein AAE02nite_08790 [Adhaeribacter aerolatus]|uniref:Glycosyltransferase 2-like domain-containing protein n=1 Tax=Adhaeribacter aerolatus TaxID=670289 RepID=A0A512AU22_9BACT|nr:glycosyltransferase family 2 protein [Adhaeribacter aerolatus]GEO03215.1 hypothetical protein AAE02nite_08790 [Adhaeribacter aerolatus]